MLPATSVDHICRQFADDFAKTRRIAMRLYPCADSGKGLFGTNDLVVEARLSDKEMNFGPGFVW